MPSKGVVVVSSMVLSQPFLMSIAFSRKKRHLFVFLNLVIDLRKNVSVSIKFKLKTYVMGLWLSKL